MGPRFKHGRLLYSFFIDRWLKANEFKELLNKEADRTLLHSALEKCKLKIWGKT